MNDELINRGLVAEVLGVSVGESARWMTPKYAAQLTGLAPERLRNWADAGYLSRRLDASRVHYRFLRGELICITALADGDEPPTLDAVRRLVRAKLKEGAAS